MGSRGMLTLCAAINSVHLFMTYLIEKKTVYAYNAKTGAVSAQLMSVTKIVGKSRFLSSSVFSLHGSKIIFLHIWVNEGADQLSGNRAARAADQRF